MANLFTKHPHSVGMTYLQHLWRAFSIGIKLIFAVMAVFIHGFFPFLFETTASEMVIKMGKELEAFNGDKHKN